MDHGPHLRQLTKLAQEGKPRFQLDWALPLEPGLETHVALYDLEPFPPAAVASGRGADEAEALFDLWTLLTLRPEFLEAIPVVTEAYERRTGRPPGATGESGEPHG